jgi:hypothetical protein
VNRFPRRRVRTPRFELLVAVCAAVVLLAAPAAQAANPVPNPGFESDCSGVPCEWSAYGQAALSTDPTTNHGGSFSLGVRTDGSFTGAQSSCIPIAPGTYNSGFWFRTTDPKVLQLVLAAETFTDSNCDFFHFGSFPFGASKSITDADRDGQWHFVAGPLDLSSGSSVQFVLVIECGPCSGGPGDLSIANFDDVTVGGDTPTAVTVTSFAASRSGTGVLVRWRTHTEAGVLGFRVYRDGRLLTRRMLAARGGPSGHGYTYRDRTVPRQAHPAYSLEVVQVGGSSRFGPLPLGP